MITDNDLNTTYSTSYRLSEGHRRRELSSWISQKSAVISNLEQRLKEVSEFTAEILAGGYVAVTLNGGNPLNCLSGYLPASVLEELKRSTIEVLEAQLAEARQSAASAAEDLAKLLSSAVKTTAQPIEPNVFTRVTYQDGKRVASTQIPASQVGGPDCSERDE